MRILKGEGKLGIMDIEKMSNYLAFKLATTLSFDKDFEEVLAYGAFTILHTLWSILLTLGLAIIFKVPLEVMIISFAASILRKYSGGIHASTPNRCAIMAALVFVSIALLINQILNFSLIIISLYCLVSFFFTYYIVYKKAPKDSPNKPIVNEEVKNSLRNKAIKVIHIFVVITTISIFIYFESQNIYFIKIAIAIASGTIWQAIILTDRGCLIISNLDILLGKIAYSMGGGKK